MKKFVILLTACIAINAYAQDTLLFNIKYIDDVVSNGTSTWIEYWDADIFDAELMLEQGYKIDIHNSCITINIDPKDLNRLLSDLKHSKSASYEELDSINNKWVLVRNNHKFQIQSI